MSNGENRRLVVKFKSGVVIPDAITPPGILGAALRLTEIISAEEAEPLIRRALENDPTYQRHDFHTYRYVDVSPLQERVRLDYEGLAQRVRELEGIENAYVEWPGGEPSAVPLPSINDDLSPLQGYLDAAPLGIGARHVWHLPGGAGNGVGLADVERGWTAAHVDLVGHAITVTGTILDTSRPHGTEVLGAICAVANGFGCTGIAYQADPIGAFSYHADPRPAMILAAAKSLKLGDVLLLEAQEQLDGSGLLGPIEVADLDYNMIRTATAAGIVVVEAGGNGTRNSPPPLDMDKFRDSKGRRILFRDGANADFRDSGAVMVSAALDAPHNCPNWAPRGKRVDCFAWSRKIVTLSSSVTGDLEKTNRNFGGTSGASAIIAGAALSVQGMAQAILGYRFNAFQMRDLLSDPALGTPCDNGKQIRSMPDLVAIAAKIRSLHAMRRRRTFAPYDFC